MSSSHKGILHVTCGMFSEYSIRISAIESVQFEKYGLVIYLSSGKEFVFTTLGGDSSSFLLSVELEDLKRELSLHGFGE